MASKVDRDESGQVDKDKSGGASIGPTQQNGGYNPSALPPNPSDEIFMGKALPTIPAQATVTRRPFSCVTKSPLHYNEGPGTDENVSTRTTNGIEIRGT